MRYKGTYRLKAHIDRITNDFPRDINGKIDTDDIYIDCYQNIQITHFGHGVLVAYIPSIGRGHNILKAVCKELVGETETDKIQNDYEQLYSLLIKEGTIKEVIETDGEIEFKFSAKHLDLFSKYLKPKTSGANISPFSSKNLPKPKEKYVIPNDEILEYKKITSVIPKDNLLLISQITKDFLFKILQKKPCYRNISIKADMKKKMLKGKEYIHSIGMWNEYLTYLEASIKEKLNESK